VTLGPGVTSQTSTLTITTTAAQAGAASAVGGGLLAAVLLAGVPALWRKRVLAHALAALVLAGAGVSCGGGGGGGGGGAAVASSVTPVGDYALTVNATSGSIAHAVTVSLAVQ
jgi:hypothetical protein